MAKEGQKIGGWTLRRHIANGGQGQVFAASKAEGDEEVAIKVIKATRPKKRARFVQEIETHVALSTKGAQNIIPILDHNLEELSNGSITGYIVMPLAQTTLQEHCEFLVGRVELCLELFLGIVNGIKNAHEADIIHRDVKPGNVLFLDKTLRTPLISDFGICLLKDTADEDRLTQLNESVGAKFFMAPEQERGGVADIRPNADIYALGKLLHNMLTGRFLYREEVDTAFNPAEIALDPRYADIQTKILKKTIVAEPQGRIQSAQELYEIISRLLDRNGTPSITNATEGKIAAPSSQVAVPEKKNSEILEFSSVKQRLLSHDVDSLRFEFDELRGDFQKTWAPINEKIKSSPRESRAAAEQLISQQRKTTAIFLAIAKCDEDKLFRPLKQFLEFVLKTSEHQTGYPAVFTVPHLQAGFLYMATSLVALHSESWKVLNKLLTEKLEWYYQSGRPIFSHGFALSYFFHPEALGRGAGQTHDFYRAQLSIDPVIQSCGLSGDALLQTYVQLQFIMSLRVEQLLESGESNLPRWPDFGRFHGYRLEPLIDRIYHDDEYGIPLLNIFGESKERFFGKLNERLSSMRSRFQGDRYFWDSLDSWEPR